MNWTVKNQQQTANLQGLLLHGKIDTKQIGSHNGQKVEAGPPQAKGPGFFGKVWIAVKSFFGGGGTKTVAAAPAPPPRSSAPETASDVRAAAPRLMKPWSEELRNDTVMRAIAFSPRMSEFSTAAHIEQTGRDGYSNHQKDVINKNPAVMKHVFDGIETLQKQSTQKEWNQLMANGNAGLVSKAIELAKEFHNPNAEGADGSVVALEVNDDTDVDFATFRQWGNEQRKEFEQSATDYVGTTNVGTSVPRQ